MTTPDRGSEADAEEAVAGVLAAASLSMARRFAAGATMWCVSGPWPAHGRHVAVEFVHPVIVGKRALPAVSVDAPDMLGALRLLARPGDLLLTISPADHQPTRRLLRHAEPWGLVRVWLGAGPAPERPPAEHVIWLPDAEPAVAARSGDLVMLYHLLWELTHVGFEHPGLLAEPDRASCPEETCITCSDQAAVAEVRRLEGAGRADVLAGGQHETVDVSLVEGVRAGGLVLVHAGVAVSGIDEEEPGQ